MCYLEIEQLSKLYNEVHVIKKLDVTIEKGEFITLLGPSGCGKSTLLRCIAGLERIDEGIIRVDGINITSLSPKNRQVGMVFQSYALFPNMNVFDNIAFGLRMKNLDKQEIKNRVGQILELLELTGRESNYPQQLSGGQQQRVALGRSLITEPKILLLDEPLSALDATIRRNLQIQLRNLQRELQMTMIFVTHDQEEALTVSDQIFVMNEGKVVQKGTPKEIYTQPQHEFVARFIGHYNVVKGLDINKLTPHSMAKTGCVAIRPEIIEIIEKQDKTRTEEKGWLIYGEVMDVLIKGNIIRYKVDVENHSFYVDQLHRDQKSWHTIGSNVQLWINEKDLIHLKQEGA